MDEVRTPCEHRGTPEVLESPLPSRDGTVSLLICRTCRRFWLERGGWLLSRREAAAVIRSLSPEDTSRLAR
jgi:hypothetical protein